MTQPTAPTTQAAPASGILTFLIADIRGYTSFTRERGDVAAATLARRFADLARDAVEARGGRVIELRGDEALAVFESPAQAVRAALELQATCAEESRSDPDFALPVGIGIDAGEAVPVEDGYRGRALNMAARLCSSAAAGDVLITRTVASAPGLTDGEVAFAERGPQSFKGFEQDVDVIAATFESTQIIGGFAEQLAEDATLPPELDPLTPLVDREHEMRWLRGTWRPVRRGRGRILFVSGPPQIGKTRLAAEFAAHVRSDGWRVRYAGPGGAGTAMALAALRDALETSVPTLLVLDDLDVAGPQVADAVAGARPEIETKPLMVLGLLRSADASPGLDALVEAANERGDGHRTLAPLDADGVREIVGLYVGDAIPDVPLESMVRSSEGVPGRVHEVASEWARSETTRRLEAAAEYLAVGRQRRAIDLELANNVIGLKLGRLYTVGGRDARRDAGDICPYKGLASFQEDDWASFFGRERLVGELAARTVRFGVLGVVGASGSGKSSLVAAGLMPSLGAGLLPGSERWAHVVMRPGDHPMASLASALDAVVTPATEHVDDPLAGAIEAAGPDGRLVLVVDQFEEVFTLCDTEEERARFIASLGAAALASPDRCVVVLTARSDYYGHVAPYPILAEPLSENHVLIGPMSRDELRRAIELPARRVGLRVEESLVDALVEEVAEEPGGLPLLSTALVELWHARDGGWIRMDAYERTGGVKGAVARLAESAFEQLNDAERDAVRRILLRLVVSDGEAITRRRADVEEFDPERDVVAERVITQLARDRLLTVGDGTIEIAHEALIREWPRLAGWLEEDQQGRQVRQQLGESARHWGGRGREPSELFRGARLSASLDWATTHGPELNELEREFLAESRQASEQETERQHRTNRRLRGLLAGVAVFLVLALIAGGLALIQRGKAQTAADQAEARRLGAQAVTEDELDLSLLLAAQGRSLEDSIDTRSTLLASLLRAPGAIGVLPGTGDRVLRIHSSAAGRTFLTADHIGGLAVYDARTLSLRRIVRLPDQASLALHPDGRSAVGQIFHPESGPSLVFVDLRTGDVRFSALEEGDFLCCDSIVYAADGRSFVSLEDRGAGPMWIRYEPTGREIETVPADPSVKDEANLSVTPDGDQIVVEHFGRLTFHDARTFVPEDAVDGAFAYDVSPDGRTLAYGTDDGRLVLVDLRTGEEREARGRHTAVVNGVGFSPDGSTIVSTGDDRDVIVWDARSAELREILPGHAGRVFGPAFDPSGDTAFTVGLDSKVIAWDLSGRRRIGHRATWAAGSTLSSDIDLLTAASPDGSLVAYRASDNDVIVARAGSTQEVWRADPWTTERFEQLRAAQHPSVQEFLSEAISSIAFSPDGATLAVSGEHQEVVLYDAGDGTELRRWSASRAGWVNQASFAPDGDLVTANDDGSVAIWDTATGREVRSLQIVPYAPEAESYRGAPAGALVSPDGTLLAVTTFEPGGPWSIRVLDLQTGDELWGGRETDLWKSVAAWSPDSRRVATGGWQSGELLLWDARTGRRLGESAQASAGFVISIDFAWDGALVVTGATDGTVRLFDTATRKQVGSNLPGVDNVWVAAHVLPRDRLLALTQVGPAFVWDLDPDRWSAQACRVANRQLTRSEWRAFLPDRPYEPACLG
jgi:WD40 repeat protein/class 3 adenylate cyclase